MAEQSKTTRWSKTAVTDAGTSLLTEFAAGRILTITSAYGSISGSGENLAELAGLPDGKAHPLTIESVTKSDDGVTVCIQVTSVGNQAAYKLEQIGIFAAAGDDAGQGGSEVDEKLLMVIEDVEDENGGKGVTVPAESDQFYAFKLYAVLAITNKERLEISVSSAGIATVGAIEEAVKGHNTSPEAHRCIAARISAVESALNGGETIFGASAPNTETEGAVGQHYIDGEGTEFVCTGVAGEGYVWEPWNDVNKSAFAAQSKLTGLPGQVVGFNEDGEAEAVPGWSSPGLIVNGDFRRVVNRNGKDEYTAAGMTIDRWSLSMSAPGISLRVLPEGGVSLDKTQDGVFGRMAQSLESPGLLAGQTVTISILAKGDTTPYLLLFLNGEGSGVGTVNIPLTGEYRLYSVTKTLRAGEITRVDAAVGYQTSAPAGSCALLGMKIDLGTRQTLAHQDADGNWALNAPPDYALQYALCSLYSPTTGAFVGSQHSNPNLLDNWYFADPINQRGMAEYTRTGYCIDRWNATVTGTVVTLVDNKLRLTAPADKNVYLLQYFERPLSPGEYTLSALAPEVKGTGYIQFVYADGTYGPAAKITESGLIVVAAVATKEVGRVVLQTNAGGSIIFEAAKLEPGLTQTLAHQDGDGNWVLNDPPPNRALELAKCQRHCIALGQTEVRASRTTDNAVRAWIPTPVRMRGNPALASGMFQVKTMKNGANIMDGAVWSFEVQGNGVRVTATSAEHGATDCVIFSNNAVLSSDL